MNVASEAAFAAVFAPTSVDTGVMHFYRSPLESGGFEYARDHGDSGRADYFDDELRIWITFDSLHDEIADGGIWTRCTELEVQDAAEAWPGAAFDISRVPA